MDVNTLLGIKSKLKLKRDTIFFDLETTGRDPIKDRIIQIGVVKIADGEVDRVWLTPESELEDEQKE